MHLPQSGVSLRVIARWLGHERTSTAYRHVSTDLAMKDKA